jgi:hypothetical protein
VTTASGRESAFPKLKINYQLYSENEVLDKEEYGMTHVT